MNTNTITIYIKHILKYIDLYQKHIKIYPNILNILNYIKFNQRLLYLFFCTSYLLLLNSLLVGAPGSSCPGGPRNELIDEWSMILTLSRLQLKRSCFPIV